MPLHPPPHLFPLRPTIASAPHHMMSARRNPISEIISWMMHKMEKRIYFGVDTTKCCCKHRNGKMRRLRRWKCIMKPGRRWWMLSNLKPREREREARTAAYGAKKKKIPQYFPQRGDEFVWKSSGSGATTTLSARTWICPLALCGGGGGSGSRVLSPPFFRRSAPG